MLRSNLLRKQGGLDEPFFLYHEDLSYGLRMRSIGLRNVVVRDAVFYHKYQFGRSRLKFFYMERNRLGTLLIYFKPATLFLLLPMAVVLEIGLLGFAIKEGWFRDKLRAYAYWLQPPNWRAWLDIRHKIQTNRTHTDRYMLDEAVSEIHFQEKRINNPLLRHLGNPLMSLYWRLIKPLIRW
jgi:GT2 family glycosyltransferase